MTEHQAEITGNEGALKAFLEGGAIWESMKGALEKVEAGKVVSEKIEAIKTAEKVLEGAEKAFRAADRENLE